MLQNVASDQVYTICHSTNSFKTHQQLVNWMFYIRPQNSDEIFMVYLPVSVYSQDCLSVRSLFPDNSFYSFHWNTSKLGGQLGYEVVQHILFWGFSIPNFDWAITLFNNFSDLTLFPWVTMHQILMELQVFKDCSGTFSFSAHSYIFHLIKLLFVCCWIERCGYCSQVTETKFS